MSPRAAACALRWSSPVCTSVTGGVGVDIIFTHLCILCSLLSFYRLHLQVCGWFKATHDFNPAVSPYTRAL
jgi:hypothetical protein